MYTPEAALRVLECIMQTTPCAKQIQRSSWNQNPAPGTVRLPVFLQANYHSSFEQVLSPYTTLNGITVSQACAHSATPQLLIS